MSSILGSYFLGSGLVFNKNEAFRGEDRTPFVEMERIARETAVTLTTGIKKVLDGDPRACVLVELIHRSPEGYIRGLQDDGAESDKVFSDATLSQSSAPSQVEDASDLVQVKVSSQQG